MNSSPRLLMLTALGTALFSLSLLSTPLPAGEPAPQGWKQVAMREAVKPEFSYLPQGSFDGKGALVIAAAPNQAESHGAWVKTFPVKGGQGYRFQVWRKTEQLPVPRRNAVVKITWLDAQGKLIPARVQGADDKVRPVFPADASTNKAGWTEVTDVYPVPVEATQAKVELHLRWASQGRVLWSLPELDPEAAPSQRMIRLASAHLRPRNGKSAMENCRQFAPLIAEAGKKQADLICLPECLTMCGTGLDYADVAEPIPGPSTEYFGKLAQKHNLYIVAGLLEKSGELVFNTAALIGPDGKLVGKYRKVCLPREEIEHGISPGHEYPVFDTRFGKLGMMICWDVHFPEVARNLANNGAEVIAMPIWGGNPTLAKARAIENQVYLVTSTYTDPNRDWMKSTIIDKEGNMLSIGKDWGTLVYADVDLTQPKLWRFLGNFRERIYRERPVEGFVEPAETK